MQTFYNERFPMGVLTTSLAQWLAPGEVIGFGRLLFLALTQCAAVAWAP